ncbi:hypothetical protein QYE76_050571 [Lolium multiflorum]|uniref:Reverse transcriptase domain-containing protein n=1 Tax=Lolium multiflorum TaxID=4521 RepID=A0AAD8SQ77_LOLMU|nr:hypothetical protein QYE76_050571 [Lolium multiflorum]
MCGLPCFTRRVRKTRVPSGFKLPENFKKFDGLQDPEDWLVDYLEMVKLIGGTRATAMQSIQVHLSGAARSWIKKLPPGSIDNWDSFEDIFVKNFRLKEDDEAKTAFITPYGVFCYRTMPFGLKNAGATYQRMMQKCLATQIGKNVQVYIDDVVITSKKGTTLIEDLKETFDNLDKFCLKLNPTKCSFGVPAGELLGFLVSARGIEANPEKIQAIVTMRKPTKLKEIQQLTGRVAALSRFVARLGEKALPFYALIKQGEKFQWNEEADRAFENLKRTISAPPILVAPKEKEPLLLYIAATPQQAGEIDNLTVSLGQSTLVVLCRFHVGAGIPGVAPHYIPPPSTFNVLLGSSCAKRTKLPEIAKTAETACDKTAEIFSNLGDNDPIAVAHNDLDFDDCHISEVIKNPSKEIFSELDEINAQGPILPRGFQKTEGKGSGATRRRHNRAARPSPRPRGPGVWGPRVAPALPFRLLKASVAKPPVPRATIRKTFRDTAAANPISGDSGDRLRHPAGEGIHLPEDSTPPWSPRSDE